MARPRYRKTTLKLHPQHTWTGTPGHQVIALDRGAVRFDFPRKWVVIPDEDSIKIHDRRPPKDNFRLAVSYIRLAPHIDWTGLPLSELVEVAFQGDERPIHTWGEIVATRRGDLEIAWRELRFVDPIEHREAVSRVCMARRGVIQAIITFEYWDDDAAEGQRVWETVLRTLRLNEYVADPTRGPWGRDQ